MARLVVNPNSPAAWEIQLKAGVNLIGRSATSDFEIRDPSVSGSHCRIVVSDHSAVITDLGSTNGTFVNRAPVKESVLETGQLIRLGGVEMMYYTDAPEALTTAASSSIRLRAATAAPVGVALPAAGPPPVPVPPVAPPFSAAPAAAGPQYCKFHPRNPGRFLCNHCQRYFCDLCVTSRNVGGVQRKFCRHCGSECVSVQMQMVRPAAPRGFFSRLPGVFIYPFRGSGFLVLVAATLVFAALEFISSGLFSILAKIVAGGYLFSYMQTIIHSTAAEDDEMPSLPGLDDVFGGFFRLLGCVLISFGPAIALAYFAIAQHEPTAGIAMFPAIILGCLYFPMALLAVAMKDSAMAANPLVVVPAIFKTPLAYMVTVILLAAVFGVRWLGEFVATMLQITTYSTKSMSTLFMALGLRAFWSFASVYLLTVNMRILGLLYLTKKHKLGWF